MKSILITGVSGHLGLAYLKASIESDFTHIYGTVRSEASFHKMKKLLDNIDVKKKVVEVVRLDLSSDNIHDHNIFSKEINVVIHNAASLGIATNSQKHIGIQDGNTFSDNGFYTANIEGTSRLYEALCVSQINLKKIVFVSSGDIYGSAGLVYENQLPQPSSSYGLSKYIGEILTNVFCAKQKIPFIVLRVGSIYGPGQIEQKGFKGFISDAIEHKTIKIFGNGLQRRNFPYVMDIARGTFVFLRADIEDILLNFSSIEIFNVNEMADKVIKYFFDKYQINVEKKYIDKDVKYDDYILDIELLKKFDNLNFTPIHEGISRQIDYEMGQKSIVELYNVL